ncbi:unnamed protein product [Rhizophagus irregularis]|nr:unnamed protein product [Rhizophagus irregularis]
MPFQPLPIECISHIFESFQDNKNLYTCLLVNRFWCRIAIPILYKTPFTRNQERNKSQRSKIISTYLSCLSNEEKIHLMKNSNNKILIPLNNNQLFDYPVYLEEFCNLSLQDMIIHWIILMIKQDFSIEQRKIFHLINNILYPLLISKSKNLLYLNLINVNSNNDNNNNNHFHFDIPDIFTFFAFTPGLTNITRLDFKLYKNNSNLLLNIINLFDIIPSLCKNIQLINFNSKLSFNDNDNRITLRKALCGIIRNQRDLKKLYLRFKGETLNNIIMPTLELQSINLTHLYFKKLRLNDDVMDSLANFLSLKVLGFESCYIITTSDNQDRYDNNNLITNNSNFQLEKLYLVENMSRHMISDIKCLIIRYFSISLQELILDELNFDIVKIISNFCSKIKRLILLATEYESIDLYNLLINLKYLKNLTLWYVNDHTIKVLGNYLPNTLLHLSFIHLICLPFNDFLKDCNIPLESIEIFNLIMNSNNSNSSDHFKPISDYIKIHYNHLKVIYFGKNCDISNEDLEEIKDYVNVKLIDNYDHFPSKFN